MTLRCPGCGAPSRTGAARCDYCLARLATVSCPACFALLLEGSAYCPHCGAAQGRSQAAEARRTRCPACRGAMQWVTVGDLDLLECDVCDGTWIEADAFERLCASQQSRAAILHGNRNQQAAVVATQPTSYRPCLRCGTMMNRMNFGRRSGTVVDVCRGHGTFLDRGELHQVVRFIHDGGLDRARLAEIEELREEQRRLEWLRHQTGHGAPPAGSFAWDEHWFRDFMKALVEKR
jgi:Zn-finger nucleic acid-binding protein